MEDGFQKTVELLRKDIDELKRNSKELTEENIDLDHEIPHAFQKTIGIVKRDIDELRRDCQELIEENIELTHKLDIATKDLEAKTYSLVFLDERKHFKIHQHKK